jgi:hypothetical protein
LHQPFLMVVNPSYLMTAAFCWHHVSTSHPSNPLDPSDPLHSMWSNVNPRSPIKWELSSYPVKIHLWEKATAVLAWQGQHCFQVRFTSLVPKAYQWGVSIDELIQFTISQCRRHLKGNKTGPQFVILGRARTMTLVYLASSGNSHHARPSLFRPSLSTNQDSSTPPGASTQSSTATKQLIT